jgi:histidinol-phosphate phosphatase family protein
MKRCNVAILAGGFGTRLKEVSGEVPKSMVRLLGKPVLERLIDLCRRFDFVDIALLVHHQHELIQEYFGDGSRFGVKITYSIESEPRGTAGALCDSLHLLADRFFVLYGDTYADIDMAEMWEWHTVSKGAGTLLLHPNDHPHDSDLVEIDGNNQVIKIHPYPFKGNQIYRNLVNAALYVLEKDALKKAIPAAGKLDLAKHTFPEMIESGMILNGYVTPEYIKDMGTPERLDRVEQDIKKGLPEKLSGRNFREAVFFDRDGTLNLEVNHLNSPDQLILLNGAAEAVRRINRAGILAVGITNQPVLARGEITREGLQKVHAYLDRLLGEGGAYLDRMFVCPHHPDKGFPGEIAELKVKCSCRKPQTGLFDLAVQELNISRRESWMVGDTTSDILAGKRAGLRTILVRTGYAGRDFKYDVEPDFVANDLAGAVDWILHKHSETASKLIPLLSNAANSRVILIGGASRTGKSSVANVLAELLSLVGKKSHVLSLDSWLKPAGDRHEGAGVMGRYQLNFLVKQLKELVSSSARFEIEFSLNDRKLRQIEKVKKVSIGPSDIVILEGVPALLDAELLDLANLSIHIDVDEMLRMKRLQEEYLWRGERQEDFMKKILSREIDEVLLVKSASHKANFQIYF